MNKSIVLKEQIYNISEYQINYSADEIKKISRVKAKQEIIMQIRADYRSGLSIKDLETKYASNFRTIKKYLSIDAYRYITVGHTEMDDFSSKIYKCMQEKFNIHQIFTEIVKDGYTSTYQNFFKQFKLRLMTNTLGNTFQLTRHNFYKLLYINDLKKLKLDEENEKCTQDFLQNQNLQSDILKMVFEFRKAFEDKSIHLLTNWIIKYSEWKNFDELQTFIKGINRDKAAVENQVINKLTNGITEGLVARLKAIKRRTYGRCGFQLLKCLILASQCQLS